MLNFNGDIFSAGMEAEMENNQEFNEDGSTMLPYEKSEAYGFESLSDEELFAIIIRSGTKRHSCMEAASALVRETKGQGIIGLQRLSVKELAQLPGIGRVKAVQLKSICELSRRMASQRRARRPCLDSAAAVVEYLMEDMRHLEQEQLRILLLDTKCMLIHEKVMSIGTVNSTLMPPREICREALMRDSTGFILVHNHPTGDPAPSREDIVATNKIFNAANLIGISLIDHIIIGDNTYISMKDDGLIQ